MMNKAVKSGYLCACVVICPVLFILSCSSSKKTTSSLVKGVQDSLPVLPASEIDLPISIYGPPLLSKAELIIAKSFTSDGWPDYVQPSCDFRYKYRFVRSPLTVSCKNNNIAVQFVGNYQVTGSKTICSMNKPVSPWISGSCGFGDEPMRRVNIAINSQINFLSSYQLHSQSSVGELHALDKCQVSLFSTNITQLIVDSIRASILYFCNALDQTIGGMNFSGVLKGSGKLMYETNLGKYGWLLAHPQAIRIGQLNYLKDSFSISVGVTCKPELGPESARDSSFPLPPLLQGENRHGVTLYVNAAYDFKFLSKIISDTLRDKVFDVNGRTIVIKDVILRGSRDHQIEVRVDFAGSNKGSIYLRGTPVLDTAKQSLTVPDLSYELESSDLLLNVARTLFSNKIKKSIQGISYLDIGALVKTNVPTLDSILNRAITSNLSSVGKTRQIRLIGLLANAKQLQIQVYIRAELAFVSNGLF